MKSKNKIKKDKARLIAILIISILVIVTGALFAAKAFMIGDISGAVLGMVIALIILLFAFIVYKRGNEDIKKGFPIQDERSKRVLEKASSKAFYVSLYLFLAIGFISDDILNFKDVSQATSIGVGGMALLFLIFWLYYNKKEI